jgi:hypothetical protein
LPCVSDLREHARDFEQLMPCIAIPGHFYRDTTTGFLFEVTHAMPRVLRVIDHTNGGNEPRILGRAEFEEDCEQVSA